MTARKVNGTMQLRGERQALGAIEIRAKRLSELAVSDGNLTLRLEGELSGGFSTLAIPVIDSY